MDRVIVRGAGDIGSAVAHRLREAGHAVVLHDTPRPAHPRRGMAFTDAFFEGVAALEGTLGKRAASMPDLERMLACGRALPVADAEFDRVLAAVAPDAIVDARMHKHDAPESQRGLARIAVGLGPGFVARGNADLVVETSWGEALGAVIREGRARDYVGEPRPIGGRGRERFVYAPVAGMMRTACAIGDAVREGDEVARVGSTPIHAPLPGILRGLTHDGAAVAPGTKIVEVDPRGDRGAAFGLGERPGRIAEGVAAALAQALGHG